MKQYRSTDDISTMVLALDEPSVGEIWQNTDTLITEVPPTHKNKHMNSNKCNNRPLVIQ